MGPVGTAGYVLVAALAVEAVFFGAVGGAVAWAVRAGLLWLEAAVVIGMPALVPTFLAAWSTARYLEIRKRWRRPWATLVALVGAMIVGFLCLRLYRLAFGFRFPERAGLTPP